MKKSIILMFTLITAILTILVLYFSGCVPLKTNPAPERSIRLYHTEFVNTGKPYSYSIFKKDLQQLQRAYPSFLKISNLGKSVLRRELYLAILGTGSRKILITGAFHGREWLTSLLLTEMIEQYAQAIQGQTKIGPYHPARLLKQVTLCFVPMVNPDGVEIVLNGTGAGGDSDLLRRANGGNNGFSRWKANARGVNLNIQFPANWDQAVSFNEPHFEKYKGPKPESEPESKALADWVRRVKPIAVVSYHSSGEVIYWQYGQEGSRYQRDRSLSRAISRATGYRLAQESRRDSHGGFKDWFIDRFKKPGFTIEIGDPAGDRPLPLSKFAQIWRQNYQVPLLLADRFK